MEIWAEIERIMDEAKLSTQGAVDMKVPQAMVDAASTFTKMEGSVSGRVTV